MPRLRLTREARENLSALPRELAEAVDATLLNISSDPEAAGKALVGRLRGLWSARVGNYRVLYTVEGAERERVVVVRAIRHRSAAYRRHRDRDTE